MNAIAHIQRIQDLLAEWRTLGSCRLRNGVELIGRMPVDDEHVWMHVVFPGLSVAELDLVERDLRASLGRTLRAFYRCCGGMNLFNDGFRLFGRRLPGVSAGLRSLQPSDIVAFNHEIDTLGWKPQAAVAFAQNSWDQTVHLTNMGDLPEQVVRCDRRTGRVLERHDDVFACIATRLFKLDQLQLQ